MGNWDVLDVKVLFHGHNDALCPPDNIENESRWLTATD
jgi:hypothetical protein